MYTTPIRVTSDGQIEALVLLMSHLRDTYDVATLHKAILAQRAQGYKLVYIEKAGTPVGVAGYRYLKMLFSGDQLYIDDLVVSPDHRSQGVGQQLMAWLADEARANGCRQIHLDSGLWRPEAHHFYERLGMKKIGYHFVQELA